MLLATATLAAIRQAYPRAKLTFGVTPWAQEAIGGNPHVDGLLDCGGVGSGRRYSLGEYLALVRRVRKGRFDLCLVLDRSPLLALVPFLAGVPFRVGLDSAGRGFPHQMRVQPQAHQHEAELYLETVRALGFEPTSPRLEFYPGPGDRRWAQERLAPLASGERQLIALHAGGGDNPGMSFHVKRWLPERLATIVDRLLDAGHTLILVGSAADSPVTRSLMTLAKAPSARRPERVLDLVGGTTFGQLGAVLQQCHLFLGHDSGPMHLAAAVGIPVVAIFGPSDPQVYGPYTPQGVALRRDADCFRRCACNGITRLEGCDYRCMEALTVDEVWEAITTLLNHEGRDVANLATPSRDG